MHLINDVLQGFMFTSQVRILRTFGRAQTLVQNCKSLRVLDKESLLTLMRRLFREYKHFARNISPLNYQETLCCTK